MTLQITERDISPMISDYFRLSDRLGRHELARREAYKNLGIVLEKTKR